MNQSNSMAGKQVLVVGMGRSGKAAADLLKEAGAMVSLYDGTQSEAAERFAEERSMPVSFGERPERTAGYDLLLLSPGVSPAKDFIREAQQSGAEIIGELELAYRLGRGRYYAITGTNGKTTTTALTGEMFQNAGRKTEIAGNIGIPVTSCVDRSEEDSCFVTECSSFQLETIRRFHPSVSALLNLTPDHLDRHGTMEAYADAKANIFMNQTREDYFVYNADDEMVSRKAQSCLAQKMPFSRKQILDHGACVRDGQILLRWKGEETVLCRRDEILIPGDHNLENALAAAAIAYCAGISADTIAHTLRTFRGVPHRIEDCGTFGGVRYINDSKGTNPDAAIKAVRSFENILLIAGGYDKGADYDAFTAEFPGRVKALVLMGATAPAIRLSAERTGMTEIYDVDNMEEAVLLCSRLAVPGDTVLLSPACASWGMYPDFEVRGDDFRNCARKLREDVGLDG